MNATVGTYLLYLALTVGVTIWVGNTLHKNGRIFLVDAFNGHEKLADSINHLLLVGFYLINIGYVSLAMKVSDKPRDLEGAVETLSTKFGVVLFVLGAMHFFNLYILSKMRKRALLDAAPPPVDPDAHLTIAERP